MADNTIFLATLKFIDSETRYMTYVDIIDTLLKDFEIRQINGYPADIFSLLGEFNKLKTPK